MSDSSIVLHVRGYLVQVAGYASEIAWMRGNSPWSRNMWIYFLLGLAIVTEVVATTALKSSAGFTKAIPSLTAIAAYVIAFYSLSLTLKQIPVGVVYAIWSGLGIILVSLADWTIYRQKLDVAALGGMFMIVLGVCIINIYSSSFSIIRS